MASQENDLSGLKQVDSARSDSTWSDSVQTSLASEVAVQVLPSPDEAASRFPLQVNDNRATDEQHAAAMEALSFGRAFGDYMAIADWTPDLGWFDRRVQAFGPFSLSPAAAVLHYAQEIFEGLKAFRWADGSVWTFRPGFNAARFNRSARRMAMPELPVEDFLGSLVQLVRADERWVPGGEDSSLYLRPFMFADEEFLGVNTAKKFLYAVISSPVGPYFKGGVAPVSIWVTTDFHRAAPGGTGDAKTGGNYASSLLPQQLADEKGYEQVLYLDAQTSTNLEELGGMNVFVVRKDGVVQTPRLNGTILEGGTRGAIIQLLKDQGRTVEEVDVPLVDIVEGIQSGDVVELFACGTAAVVTPIGRLGSADFEIEIGGTEVAVSVLNELGGIQRGTIPDRHGWMYRLV